MAQSTFAEHLAKLLKKHGTTQKELAERVGVTEATMLHYMHTKKMQTYNKWLRYASPELL